ncbi:TIGR04086 family membrane protein [Amphibacillus cookii]|uniref:TIGR04086 family membrane protein n=1 Tax=Amphibacillus cookii TaxID=767787 RepID=UPI0019594C44|nr:putative membrane protein (TIGR04086 family) [Amphibacillus cookii]
MKQHTTALIYGWMMMITLLILSSFILALGLQFTSLTNPLLGRLTTIIAFLMIFFSAFVSGVKAKQNGWLIGLILGLGFSLMIYLYQYLGYGEHFSMHQSLYHLGFLIVSTIGAILGVNLLGSRTADD